jgi:hypothetical protein
MSAIYRLEAQLTNDRSCSCEMCSVIVAPILNER